MRKFLRELKRRELNNFRCGGMLSAFDRFIFVTRRLILKIEAVASTGYAKNRLETLLKAVKYK